LPIWSAGEIPPREFKRSSLSKASTSAVTALEQLGVFVASHAPDARLRAAARLRVADTVGAWVAATGTAEVGANREFTQPWFICFAPVEDPRMAVAVTLERTQGQGGTVAAPIAKSVLEALLGGGGG